ncbi:hypothetical protein FACS1894161_1750 [Spirochaetia bacterium]|nr:hypothetical protein FACS1894161_1750 [Spirochaetia bacterium]
MTAGKIKNKLIRTFFIEQWSLLICDKKGKALKHIVPPENHIWADPFPVEHDGKIFIFIEQQIGHNNGTLGFIELDKDMNHSPFTPILEKEYHLSYPQVFQLKQDGRLVWYMIPESHENRTIDVYRALEFPRCWTHETTLMNNLNASDSTVFFYNNLWWLFTSIGDDFSSRNSNLSLFYSDRFPSNTWKAHPLNPVSTDPANSRMAGSIFIEAGKLFRPAQDCTHDYGQNININAIISLDTESFKEEKVKTIRPEKEFKTVCTHTINYCGSFLLRDIKTRKIRRII